MANFLQRSHLIGLLSAIPLVLSFEPFALNPLAFIFPVLLFDLCLSCRTPWEGFKKGYLVSLWLMIFAFYWVTYVVRIFGNVPWAVAVIVFLGFCAIGALNLPLFGAAAGILRRRVFESSPFFAGLWLMVGLPALFTVIEFFIPKLFPWYVGHGLHQSTLLIQICEITGTSFLTFSIFSLGGMIFALWRRRSVTVATWTMAIPLLTWALIAGFGAKKLSEPASPSRSFKVALIQPNIGSLEKLAAKQGIAEKVRFVLDKYRTLTGAALFEHPDIDLIVWPETAMPFILNQPSPYTAELEYHVRKWNKPLITGGYAHGVVGNGDHNAAFLLEPVAGKAPSEPLRMNIYPKNVLLAFGEYMPLGKLFPKLYEWFPTVANFTPGVDQMAFTLSNGVRIGITICYEAIIPEFVRHVVRHKPHLILNLTNDSWFGPTSEPLQHAQLSLFRTVEHGLPMVRVTNTGVSFAVDKNGRMSEGTPIYAEAVKIETLMLSNKPEQTFYFRYGDWIVALFAGIVAILLMLTLKYAPVPH